MILRIMLVQKKILSYEAKFFCLMLELAIEQTENCHSELVSESRIEELGVRS